MTKASRIRLVRVIALAALATAGAFLACGGGLDPEVSPEVCEGGACETGVSPEEGATADGGSNADAPATARDGSSPGPDGGRDASDGGLDASDGARDAVDTGPAPAVLAPCDDGGLPGMLDPTFGDGGVVYINADPTLNSYAQAVVVQPDGKVVLAGTISKTAERRFALIRLTVTGSLDTGFGDAGIVSTAFPSGKGGIATAVALTADGRILAGGNVYVDATSTDFAIARYSPGGTLDTTFGDGGVAFAGFGPPEGGGVTSIAVLPDGHVLAAGYRGLTAGAMSNDHAVAKFDVNGSRDATFGAGGRVKVDIRGTNDAPNAMLVQSDGRIVLAGSSGRPPMSFADLSVVRLQPDGSLDPSWGTAGKVVHVIGAQSSSAYAASVDGAGRMVLGGGIYGTIEDFLVVRLTSTGSLDSAFGSGGVVTTDFGGNSEFAARLYIQPDGKIVQVGRSSNGTPPVALGFARHQSDGSPDLGFGVGGKVLSVKPSGFDDYAAAFSRGRVTLVGLGSPGGVGGVPWLWMGAARFCL